MLSLKQAVLAQFRSNTLALNSEELNFTLLFQTTNFEAGLCEIVLCDLIPPVPSTRAPLGSS